jgi:hypothetical protein
MNRLKTEITDILKEIHDLTSDESPRVKSLRVKAHELIIGSNISYGEIYIIIKNNTNSSEEFNEVMGRIRKIILERDGV